VNCEEIALSSTVMFVSEKSCLVTRESGDIHLTPNERRLLELIISGKCKKETIFDEIWHNQGTVVSESSYHQLIKMLRRKLQQAGLPGSMIKTIPRYGVVLAPEECACTEENDAPCCESTTASEEVIAPAEALCEPEKQGRNLRARWLWLCLLPIALPHFWCR
jgi:DNA-binding winged-HTH domains